MNDSQHSESWRSGCLGISELLSQSSASDLVFSAAPYCTVVEALLLLAQSNRAWASSVSQQYGMIEEAT